MIARAQYHDISERMRTETEKSRSRCLESSAITRRISTDWSVARSAIEPNSEIQKLKRTRWATLRNFAIQSRPALILSTKDGFDLLGVDFLSVIGASKRFLL